MIIAFYGICLLVTVFTLWLNLTIGEHSRAHRLMSMVILLVFFFDLMQLLGAVSGEYKITYFTESLIVTQILYLMFFYVLEYHEINLYRFSGVLLVVLILFDCTLMYFYNSPRMLSGILELYVCIYYFMIIVATTIPRLIYKYSKRERNVAITLTMAFFIPLVLVFLQVFFVAGKGVIVSAGFLCTMLIIMYLFFSGKLADSRLIVGDRVYSDSPIATALFDENMFFMAINDAALSLFEDYIKSVVGDAKDIRHENVQVMVADFISDKHDGDVFEFDMRFYRWSSREIYENKRLRGYIMQMIDVTEEINEVKKLENLKDVAERENEHKANLLAHSTHDLRTPLHAILGVSDILMSREYIKHEDRKLLSYVNVTGNSLMRIVNSILDYSKLESGLFNLVSREYHIIPVLNELLQMCVINLSSKPVTVHMSVNTEYPDILIGDELRIKEMIQNILSNAIKFTDEGDITCELFFENKDDETTEMKCVITDTGVGMSEKMLKTLFEPFESDANEKYKEGTGIGMSVLKSLAELMDGGVWAESDGKTGSVIGFKVMQKYVPGRINEPIELDNLKQETDIAALSQVVKPNYIYPKARVLLADDIDLNREIFYNITRPWQFILEEVKDGEAAVDMVKTTKYDLIVLDNFMPLMTGTEAAKIIHSLCDTPLVLMSANIEEEKLDSYSDDGFAAVLTKPLNMNSVREVMEKLLPEEKRLEPTVGSTTDEKALNYELLKRKRRTFALYAEEVRGLIKNIEFDFDKNIDNFRVKVHGNKGSSKTIGKHQMAYYSEIMEMAAKADHRGFIGENLEDYIEELKGTLEEVNKSIERMDLLIESEKKSSSANVKDTVDELFAALKTGFETYNMTLLETAKDRLLLTELSAGQKKLLDAAIKDIYEFEYEHGASLFENFE
ncbi:MAG: response regulator [Eubacterium sp.]|nr:response regulator [Eubacterium sp.]